MRSLRVPEGARGYIKRACQVGPHRASMRGRSEGLANFYGKVGRSGEVGQVGQRRAENRVRVGLSECGMLVLKTTGPGAF